MSTQEQALSMEAIEEFLRRVYGFMEGAVVSGMVYLGDRLDLYKAMQGAGPLTADELAERTGLHPRWVLEWLRNQAAADLVAYRGDGRFELTPAGAFVLADEEHSPAFSAGAFSGLPQQLGVLTELEECFRTGIGLPFDAQGREGNHAVARMFAPWFRHMLVPVILPALDGVTQKLEARAKVADVGCGAGVALCTMAKAFPSSELHGYDISEHALALAEETKRRVGVDNVTFHDVRAEELPADGRFDLVTAFDCIHDMTHPQEVLSAVRKALRDDGTFLVGDIKGKPTFEENLRVKESDDVPIAMMYGFSVLSCMSSALSEPDGAGLGTLGFHEEKAREMAKAAGFSRFAVHDFDNPVNLYYEIRP